MAPRRKVAQESPQSTPSKKSKRTASDTPPKEKENPLQGTLDKALKDISLSPADEGITMILGKVIQFYEDMVVSKNSTVDEYLCELYADAPGKQHFAELIEQLWPHDHDIQYASDYSPGKKQFRPWMMGFHKMQGNKGFVEYDIMKTMISLIVVQGFRSDGEVLPGVEKLLTGPTNPVFFDKPVEFPPIRKGMLKAFEVGEDQGWTRIQGLLFFAEALLKLDLGDAMKKICTDDHWKSYSTVYAIHNSDAKTDADRIVTNHQMKMQSVAVRKMPNCFNILHQIEKQNKLGVATNTALKFMQTPKTLKSVFGIGAGEADACCNLLSIPTEARETFKAAAREFGVVRGPVNHNGLASEFLLVGKGPEMPTTDCTAAMRNDETTVCLIAKRVVNDFRRTPPGLRRTLGHEGIKEMQQLCRAFRLTLGPFQASVCDEDFKREWPLLEEKFAGRYLDQGLMDAVDSCQIPIDLMGLSEFRVVIMRLRYLD